VINKRRRSASIQKSESRFLDKLSVFFRDFHDFRGFSVKIISGDLDTGYTEEHGTHGKKKFFLFQGKTSEKGKDSVLLAAGTR
jgi:hypothetical protein